jgi:tungstate transport system ATP-binding protein
MDNMQSKYTRFIELNEVIVKSDGKVILDIPHAIIPTDHIVGCVGPNGAGKTSLLKLINGLIKPDAGTIRFSSPVRSSLVLHHTPMIKASVLENISMVRDADPSITTQAINDVIDRIGLKSFVNNPAQKLSAGERQKLCLGRAILQKPNLILLDEPTANLDPNTTEQVEKIILEFKENGADVIFISHQLSQVQRLADYIIFIDQGQIIEKGPVGPFFSNPQSLAAKHYLQRELVEITS